MSTHTLEVAETMCDRIAIIHGGKIAASGTMAELQRTGHAPRLLARMTTADLSRLWSALTLPAEPGTGLLLSTRSSDHGMLSQLMSRWSTVALSYGYDRRSRARDRLVMLLAADRDSIVDARDHYAAAVIHAVLDLIALSRMAPDLAMTLMMRSELYPQAIQRIASSPLADMLNWLVPLSQTPDGRERLSLLAEAASRVVRPRPFNNGDSDVSPVVAQDDEDVTEPPSPAIVTGEMDQDGERGSSGGEQSESAMRVPDTSGEDSSTAEIHGVASRAALTSPVGSIFLLAPALAETRLWEYWQAEHGEETARGFIFALALKALGRSRAPLYLDDVMLASFAGLDQPPVATSRTRADTDERPEMWPAAIPEIAARWYPEIDRDLTEDTAEGLEVIRDNKASFWLAAWPAGTRDTVDAQAIYQMLLARQSGSPRRMTDAEQSALEAEAAHFQLGRRVGFPWLTPSVDAALSTATSLVLRRTAARLPRMGQSSPSYLATQFLAQPATVHYDNVSATVELSGGPLGIVLRLAALPDWIHAPWLSRPVSLRVASDSGQT
jgi:hypothetical protein